MRTTRSRAREKSTSKSPDPCTHHGWGQRARPTAIATSPFLLNSEPSIPARLAPLLNLAGGACVSTGSVCQSISSESRNYEQRASGAGETGRIETCGHSAFIPSSQSASHSNSDHARVQGPRTIPSDPWLVFRRLWAFDFPRHLREVSSNSTSASSMPLMFTLFSLLIAAPSP